eukprot:gnl/TRDRNA2_/TRDRNA2_83201_c0_seq1.p1 gnl/TRDRNA2_/TRDRNA2_83201_c0~~gnl/TRDRNA2_/TRDRNA2_83201_c0_seq1.p1  ORF type:complete len:392 (-),score=55.16 gnl/TRDRNA2_/TRDRNA2_83201_c0_seq1:104-1279(-)
MFGLSNTSTRKHFQVAHMRWTISVALLLAAVHAERLEMTSDVEVGMNSSREEVQTDSKVNPVTADPLYMQILQQQQFLSPAGKKQALGEICKHVVDKVRRQFDVRVTNLCFTQPNGVQSCPPVELPIKLAYMRALQNGHGLDVPGNPVLHGALQQAFWNMPPYFAQCVQSRVPGVNLNAAPYFTVIRAALSRFYGVGNCGEMADLVFTEATQWSALLNFRLEAVGGENYDHAWTAFNRNPYTDISQPATWNEDAVICDGWLGVPFDPKHVVRHPLEASNPNLTPAQRAWTVGRSHFLHNTLPTAGVTRSNADYMHSTHLTATGDQVMQVLPPGAAANMDMWHSDLVQAATQCAAQTDQEVAKFLQAVPGAYQWVAAFSGRNYQKQVAMNRW